MVLGMKVCGPKDSVHSLGSNLKAGDSGAGALEFDESVVCGRSFFVGDAVFLRPRLLLDLVFLTGGASAEASEPAVKANAPCGTSFVNHGPGDSVGFLSKAGYSPCGFALSVRFSPENLVHNVRYRYLYSARPRDLGATDGWIDSNLRGEKKKKILTRALSLGVAKTNSSLA